MRQPLLKLATLFLFSASAAFAQCSSTAYGSYTCKQSCTGGASGSPTMTCVMGSNLTAGSMVYVFSGQGLGTTVTSVAGCGLTWTLMDTGVPNEAHATAPNAGTGACTITITWSGSVNGPCAAVEILGTNQTVDKHGAPALVGPITSGNPINAPTITTVVNGDFVMMVAFDIGGNGGSYTAGTGTVLVQALPFSYSIVIQGQVQATAGAITPSVTYSQTASLIVASVALEKAGPASHGFPIIQGH